jgi:ATPase subunit of ABC transporter with duplicated ATPase domains
MKNLRELLQKARQKVWEDAPVNSVGTGANLSMPPAVEPFVSSKKKKSYDGRTKDGRKFVNTILLNRDKRARKKMTKEELNIVEADENTKQGPSETERAQKQITQQKKLNKQKEIQQKSQEAKTKMQNKTKEMDTLMKARLSDFRKKAGQKTTQLQKQNNSFDAEGSDLQETIGTIQTGREVLATLMRLAGDATFEYKEGFVQFPDGRSMKINSDIAKRVVSTFEALDHERQQQYRFLMNKDVESFLKIMQFSTTAI